MNTTHDTKTEQAKHQAKEDEFVMSSGDELYKRLVTISGQYVYFENSGTIGFTNDFDALAFKVSEGHYHQIGTVDGKQLVVYKVSKDVAYGLFDGSDCVQIGIDSLIRAVVDEKHASLKEAKAEMTLILSNLDELIALTQ